MHRTVVGRLAGAMLVAAILGPSPSAQIGLPALWFSKLDPLLQARASRLTGLSRVIVRADDAASLALALPIIRQAGGTLGRPLSLIYGQVVDLPNASLALVASIPLVRRLSLDRLVAGAMERTGATTGAAAARQAYGYDGSGVGVAIIDSGATPSHDDLADPAVAGTQRVDQFVDFVGGQQVPYDDYGHGTHVAGIVAGNGFDSAGARSGIAPGARLMVLKVLDGSGRGRISDVIAALDYVVVHKADGNIRVVNLSVATGVYESYDLDPLTLAARRTVDAGIVVVAAAGNNGRGPSGRARYGGITAPGNAPWVLTVGASSHMGTVDRADDTIAAFSSRGPSAVDHASKPDLVAPGVGIESLADPDSAFYVTKSPYLLSGSVATAYRPYLSLSGTSMAAPVVSGTVALMLQANPALTPNQVKAILQYTAQSYSGYDRMTQGAGFLDAKRAIDVARSFVAADTASGVQSVVWDLMCSTANCQSEEIGWSASAGNPDAFGTSDDETVVWGTSGSDDETVVWGTSCSDPSCQPVMWDNP